MGGSTDYGLRRYKSQLATWLLAIWPLVIWLLDIWTLVIWVHVWQLVISYGYMAMVINYMDGGQVWFFTIWG
jgi:hypothetical protein